MREFAPNIVELGESLTRSAGSYLRNTIREHGMTCSTCATPVADGYSVCLICLRQQSAAWPVADRVGSLVYAVKSEGEQTYKVVRNYKDPRPGPSTVRTMHSLIALTLRAHAVCASLLAGCSSARWAVVPSTKGRTALSDFVRSIAVDAASHEVPIDVANAAAGRDFDPRRWSLANPADVPEHVLVIDDSWVSGAHAQSLAAALKSAGVGQVSILTVARVLDPAWPQSSSFIKERLSAAVFEWSRCPWTGAACPEVGKNRPL